MIYVPRLKRAYTEVGTWELGDTLVDRVDSAAEEGVFGSSVFCFFQNRSCRSYIIYTFDLLVLDN